MLSTGRISAFEVLLSPAGKRHRRARHVGRRLMSPRFTTFKFWIAMSVTEASTFDDYCRIVSVGYNPF